VVFGLKIISDHGFSLLNLQGKSGAFLCGGGGVYFHSLWTRVEEICGEEVILKTSHENQAFKNQEMVGKSTAKDLESLAGQGI